MSETLGKPSLGVRDPRERSIEPWPASSREIVRDGGTVGRPDSRALAGGKPALGGRIETSPDAGGSILQGPRRVNPNFGSTVVPGCASGFWRPGLLWLPLPLGEGRGEGHRLINGSGKWLV